jgi:hypothetical protein
VLDIDTDYVRTYTVLMNITLSIDEQVAERAREKLRAMGKSLNQEIREHLQSIAGDSELEAAIEAFKQRVGQGHSNGWKWDRSELYDERTEWPRKQAAEAK